MPRDVTYLALHHQRMLRLMAARRKRANATLDLLPGGRPRAGARHRARPRDLAAGMGGDTDDPGDAILGAANHLRRLTGRGRD